ncbi:cysteine hydrolase family protein [Anaerotignum sp.]
MDCLLVIDVQNGFVSESTEHIVPEIVALMDAFEGVSIATKFVNQDNSPYERFMEWDALKTSPEIDLLPEVEKRADIVIEKPGYTACTEEVMQYLSENKIDTAYLVGIDTDCCVLKTAADLFEYGIRPVVLADYCASSGGKVSHDAGLLVLERTIGEKQIISGKFQNRA